MASNKLNISPEGITVDGVRLHHVTDIEIRSKGDLDYVTMTFFPGEIEYVPSPKFTVFTCVSKSWLFRLRRKTKYMISGLIWRIYLTFLEWRSKTDPRKNPQSEDQAHKYKDL